MSARHPPASPDRAGTIANLAKDSTPPCSAATKRSGRLAVIVAQEAAEPFVTLDCCGRTNIDHLCRLNIDQGLLLT